MIAEINNEEFETKTANEYVRIPQVGDWLEMNLGSNPDNSGREYEPNWIKFWNDPIRNEEEAIKALEIIKTKGMVHYSRPHFARNYRAVSPVSLEELSI